MKKKVVVLLIPIVMFVFVFMAYKHIRLSNISNSKDIYQLNNEGETISLDWEKNYGGNFSEYAHGKFEDVIEVSDGYVAVGSTDAKDIEGLENKDLTDAIIVKYDTNGNIVWQKNWGGNNDDYFNSVLEEEDGYVVVGYSDSNDIEGINNKGSYDAIIVKYDTDGNIVWQKNWGGSKYEIYKFIGEVEDGYVVVGESYSSDIEEIENKGLTDAVIIKYDTNGNIVWQKNWGGSSSDYFNSVLEEEDGYVVVGYSDSSDIEGINNKGRIDAIIVKYDTNGNIVWQKNWGGNSYDEFTSILNVEDGYVVVGSSDIEGIENNGSKDAIIVKYDTNGNVVWQKNWGGNSYDEFNSIVNVEDGYVIVGSSDSSDIEGIDKQGYYDAIIVKYNTSGNIVWQKNWGGSSSDYFNSVVAEEDGYVVVGESYSNDIEGIDKQGYYDAIIVKYDTSGNVICQKNYSGTFGSYANTDYSSIIEIEKGYVAVGSTSALDIEEIDKQLYYDAIIVKYDTDGNILWQKNWGGNSYDEFNSIVEVEDGYIVVGESYSDDIDGIDNKGTYDAIIVKYDTDGNILWQKNWGGNSYDEFDSIVAEEDGYVVVGYSDSSDIEGINNKGRIDAIIVKYDTNGNIVWQKNWGGIYYDYFNSVVAEKDGYIVIGSSSSSDIEGIEKKGSNDAIIIKYDTDGNIVWQKNWGGEDDEEFNSIIAVEDGYVTVGYTDSWNISELRVYGWYAAIIIKYDKDGNVIWQKNYGGSDGERFYALIEDNGYIVVGSSESDNIEGLENKGATDAIIVKYDKDGNIVWQKNWGGNNDDYFKSLVKTSDGYTMVGESYSTNIDGINILGSSKAVIVKYKCDGCSPDNDESNNTSQDDQSENNNTSQNNQSENNNNDNPSENNKTDIDNNPDDTTNELVDKEEDKIVEVKEENSEKNNNNNIVDDKEDETVVKVDKTSNNVSIIMFIISGLLIIIGIGVYGYNYNKIKNK